MATPSLGFRESNSNGNALEGWLALGLDLTGSVSIMRSSILSTVLHAHKGFEVVLPRRLTRMVGPPSDERHRHVGEAASDY
jgi:hypothetical protein